MAELLWLISDVRCVIFGSGAVWGMGIELVGDWGINCWCQFEDQFEENGPKNL